MNQKLSSIRVGAFDPNNPNNEPSEVVTITCEVKKQTYQILIHSPAGVDELIEALIDAKKLAWKGDGNDGESSRERKDSGMA